ncbi:MAG: tetratricopeptide repeat protein [Opitutaceae bacterium]|nr:tetratricopeptide repeat protein [Opitutaceae bacterium]
MMKFVLVSAVAALLVAGCKPAVQPLSERDRSAAAALSSEASFAMNLREWDRAEKLLLQAIKITPAPEFYHNLGSVRMRAGNRAGAKDAYQSAIDACERLFAADKANTGLLLKKVQLLALIGRRDEARAFLAKIDKDYAKDPAVRAFVDGKRLDEVMASPLFKEIAL